MDGAKLVDDYWEATIYQQTFLQIMAAKQVSYDRNIETRLTALCEANGIKFKDKAR